MYSANQSDWCQKANKIYFSQNHMINGAWTHSICKRLQISEKILVEGIEKGYAMVYI